MDKHTEQCWQRAGKTRLWAYTPGGAVIIADFGVSDSLRHETKVANAKRAKLCVQFCDGLSDEDIERLMKLGFKAGHWTTNGEAHGNDERNSD